MGMWDFSEYTTKDLQQAEEHITELKQLGIPLDNDMTAEISDELEERQEFYAEDLMLETAIEKHMKKN